jgi:hypothetical protein
VSSIAVPGARTQRRRAVGATRRSHDAQEPWRRRDAAGLVVVGALGVAGLVTTWVGISGTVRLSAQARWLGLGIGSVILAGCAMVGWLVLGMLRISVLRHEVISALNARDAAVGTAPAEPVGEHMFGVAPGMRRYHRPDCRLLVGKKVVLGSLQTHAKAGLAPCGICTPPAGPAA